MKPRGRFNNFKRPYRTFAGQQPYNNYQSNAGGGATNYGSNNYYNKPKPAYNNYNSGGGQSYGQQPRPYNNYNNYNNYSKPNSFRKGPYSYAHFQETNMQEHGVTKQDINYQKFLKNDTYISATEWQNQNSIYCLKRPEIVTELSQNSLVTLMRDGYLNSECDESTEQQSQDYHLQVILVKFCDTVKQQGGIKARLMISDGTHAAIAIINSIMYDKLELGENQELRQLDIIKIKKCVVKEVGNKQEGGKLQKVVVFTEPIKIVYSNLTTKIGAPSQNFEQPFTGTVDLRVPYEEIMKNLDVEEHEIIYAKGGNIPISKLYSQIKGLWRIKIRCSKKYDVHQWNNEKGEGKLLNMEFLDRDGIRMQATIFKELVDEFAEQFIVGNVYEVCQGQVKRANAQFGKNKYKNNSQGANEQSKSEWCLVFDKFTKVKPVDDDTEIPSLEATGFDDNLNKVEFISLLQISDCQTHSNVNIMGIIHKVGPIEEVKLKTGVIKHRRKVLVCDDGNLSIVICFWAERHLEKLENQMGNILAIVKVRVSDYYHKSLNSNEDSKVFINPLQSDQEFARLRQEQRVTQLSTWYKDLKNVFTFHALSGTLDVENKPPPPQDNSFNHQDVQNDVMNGYNYNQPAQQRQTRQIENPEDMFNVPRQTDLHQPQSDEGNPKEQSNKQAEGDEEINNEVFNQTEEEL